MILMGLGSDEQAQPDSEHPVGIADNVIRGGFGYPFLFGDN